MHTVALSLVLLAFLPCPDPGAAAGHTRTCGRMRRGPRRGRAAAPPGWCSSAASRRRRRAGPASPPSPPCASPCPPAAPAAAGRCPPGTRSCTIQHQGLGLGYSRNTTARMPSLITKKNRATGHQPPHIGPSTRWSCVTLQEYPRGSIADATNRPVARQQRRAVWQRHGSCWQQGAARRQAFCFAEVPSHLRLMLARLAALVLGIDSPRISAISSSSPVRGT
jgi:hypothetical protein